MLFFRFAIDKMQSACLDEYGGEKAVDLNMQETTIIQHIFGGRLQSQVSCVSTLILIIFLCTNSDVLHYACVTIYQMYCIVPNLKYVCRFSVLHVEWSQTVMII